MKNQEKALDRGTGYNLDGYVSEVQSPESFQVHKSQAVTWTSDELGQFLQQIRIVGSDDLQVKLVPPARKRSFLVFKNNKYVNIPTKHIAYFYIRHESCLIMCFDQREFIINYSLEQIQFLLPEKMFFRLNRQYLINFNAVKEVEHYFARKLLVNLVVAAKDQLIVSKEKVSEFLHWLDNR